jgi:hypothetical protein
MEPERDDGPLPHPDKRFPTMWVHRELQSSPSELRDVEADFLLRKDVDRRNIVGFVVKVHDRDQWKVFLGNTWEIPNRGGVDADGNPDEVCIAPTREGGMVALVALTETMSPSAFYRGRFRKAMRAIVRAVEQLF